MPGVNRSRIVAAAGGLALFAALVPVGLSAATPPGPVKGRSDCTPLLNKPLGGAEAVEALGANIKLGAQRAGMTVAEFARTLQTDSTLRVDVCGYPFYVEPVAPAAAAQAESAPVVGEALNASGNPFTLASRPGSLRTIYLDFTGAIVSGTSWNNWVGVATINAPPFSLDADGTTFTAAEQDVVREVWLRVAEDYAPFDVNVTTADPGFAAINRSSSADTTYGAIALITKDTLVYGACGCGGVAYVGTFNLAGSNTFYQPAWVFQLGTGSAKSMAEAASHEVGHNLGLSHDGTFANGANPAQGYYAGHGAWAPIMGVGYYRPVTQWSRGEYSYADNTQDDLAVINSLGLATAADDHGGTAATATVLGPNSTVAGVIGTRTDTDWFRFNGSGIRTISVAPQSVGPNLDIVLRIYNAAGALVGTYDPAVAMVNASTATGLNATVTANFGPGNWYAVVDGIGYGNPANTGYSDYGSLGRYDISLAVPAVAISTASVPNGRVAIPYTASLVASGGTTPYTWTLSAGTLPPGLTLFNTGVIQGIPTAVGVYAFTAKVTDATGAVATKSFTLTVTTWVTNPSAP